MRLPVTGVDQQCVHSELLGPRTPSLSRCCILSLRLVERGRAYLGIVTVLAVAGKQDASFWRVFGTVYMFVKVADN